MVFKNNPWSLFPRSLSYVPGQECACCNQLAWPLNPEVQPLIACCKAWNYVKSFSDYKGRTGTPFYYSNNRINQKRYISCVPGPLKVRSFLWIIYKSILTCDRLMKRSCNGSSICVLWSANAETLDHLFMTSPYSLPVWEKCRSIFQFSFH